MPHSSSSHPYSGIISCSSRGIQDLADGAAVMKGRPVVPDEYFRSAPGSPLNVLELVQEVELCRPCLLMNSGLRLCECRQLFLSSSSSGSVLCPVHKIQENCWEINGRKKKSGPNQLRTNQLILKKKSCVFIDRSIYLVCILAVYIRLHRVAPELQRLPGGAVAFRALAAWPGSDPPPPIRWRLSSSRNKSRIVSVLLLCWGLQLHF